MPLVLTSPGTAAAPVRLTSEWHQLAGLPEGSACRIRELADAHGAASVENVSVGQTAIHVEVLQDGSYQLADFIDAGEAGVIGANSRLFVSGHQEATTFYIATMAPGSSSTPGAAAAAAVAGKSKRPLSADTAAAAAAVHSSGEDEDGSKRQRRASHSQAGPSGSTGIAPPEAIEAEGALPAASRQAEATAASGSAADPLDRIPDAPMHLMRVRGIPSWANDGFLGVTLGDVVRGDMRWCLISNYMLDFAWLLSACPDLRRAGRLVVVHGEGQKAPALMIQQHVREAGLQDRCTIFAPPLPIFYGTHHSKAFIIEYDKGVRVIIFTANAIYPDCNNKSQGLFWQDFPPNDGQSPQTSAFQTDLAEYVAALRLPPSAAKYCRELLDRHDFSAARAHIVASVPGYHKSSAMYKWGHLRLRACLNREPPFPPTFRGAPLAVQYSSLGSLEAAWLEGEFRESLSAGRCSDGNGRLGLPPAGPSGLQLVWTAVTEVQNSIEGWRAGQSIPGPANNVDRPFLQPYYHRWGGEVCGRQRAAPHIKSYLRYRGDDVAWMYVGSNNLSKAAWGALQKKGEQLMVRSYELGVLLVPSLEAAYRASRWQGFSCTSAAPLPAQQGGGQVSTAAPAPAAAGPAAAQAAAAAGDGGATAGAEGAAGPAPVTVRFVPWQRGASQHAELTAAAGGQLLVPLPIPYRLPPQRYEPGDKPWAWDADWPGLDSLGCTKDNPHGRFYGLLEEMEWGDI